MKISFILLMPVLCLLACKKNDNTQKIKETPTDTIVNLRNENLQLTIDLYGGAFTSLTLNESQINPFTWQLIKSQMPENNKDGAVFQGHFLCLGRWGKPSAGEIVSGIPHNGEPANSLWQLQKNEQGQLQMKSDAPLEGLSVVRKIDIHTVSPILFVEESVTNNLNIGRIYNIVQHPTLGPPLLDTSLVVNTNAGPGFLQKHALPNPSAFSYNWPLAALDSLNTPLDLRQTVNSNYVTTHVFEDSIDVAWVTAFSPTFQLILGYCWRTNDYPWLNIWNHFENGKPMAKGLEFGTTGIGADYETLLAQDTRFKGYNSFEFIDAGATVKKSYYLFMLKAPINTKNIEEIGINNNVLFIRDQNKTIAEFNLEKFN
jgi:hypothetical protein